MKNNFLARQTCAVMETAGEEGGTKRRSVEYSDVSLFQDDESTEPPRKKQAVGAGNQRFRRNLSQCERCWKLRRIQDHLI